MKGQLVLALITLLIPFLVHGQQDNLYRCGLELDTKTVAYLTKKNPSQAKVKGSRSTTGNNLPIRVYVISNVITDQQAIDAVDYLNESFVDASLNFELYQEVVHLDLPTYLTLDINPEADLLANNHGKHGVLNLFVVNEICNTTTCLINGFAQLPNGTNSLRNNSIFMKADVLDELTFAHETGHYLGLYHTHGKFNTLTSQCNNSANSTSNSDDVWCQGVVADNGICDETGDDVCDTPAEPPAPIAFSQYTSSNNECSVDPQDNCNYSGTSINYIDNTSTFLCDPTDPLGAEYTLTLLNNIMSYVYPRECRSSFTGGQETRMFNTYLIERQNLKNLFFSLTPVVSNACEDLSFPFYGSGIVINGEIDILVSNDNLNYTEISTQTVQLGENILDIDLPSYPITHIKISFENDLWADTVSLMDYIIDDLNENDNSSSSAYDLGPIQAYNEDLTLYSGDEDWFQFSHNSDEYYIKVSKFTDAYPDGCYVFDFNHIGSSVTITTLKNGIFDTDTELTLFNSQLSQIGYNNNFNGTVFSQIIYDLDNTSTCEDPIITNTDITCINADSYSIEVTFTGESGVLYDIYGSQSGSSFISNQPPGTYTITGNNDNQGLTVTVQNDEDSSCQDDFLVTNNNCSSNCTDPVIFSATTDCQTSTYNVNVGFNGTAGSVYDVYATSSSSTYSGPANVPPGTYTITGIPIGVSVDVSIDDDGFPNECNDTWSVPVPNCGTSCTDPNIMVTNTNCQSSNYSISLTFSGTSGSLYDIYASGATGTYSGPSNVPPGTYTISGIPFNEDVTTFIEDVSDPTVCNDSQFVNAPTCAGPTISVNWPNSTGQCFDQGENVTITWSSTGTINTVNIEYCENGGSCFEIIANTNNDGSHNWTVENVTGDYYIKIYDPANTPTNDSGNVFEVDSNCSGPCDDITITLELPSSGTIYDVSQPITFQWDAQNIGSGSCDLDEYYIEFSATPNMDSPFGTNVSVAFYNGFFSAEGSWYWRIRAKNIEGNYGPWSTTRHVKVCDNLDPCKGFELELASNISYSNPFCNGQPASVTVSIRNDGNYVYYGEIHASLLSSSTSSGQVIETFENQILAPNEVKSYTFNDVIDVVNANDWILAISEKDSDMEVDFLNDGDGDNILGVAVDYNCGSSGEEYTWSYGNTSTGNTDDPDYLPINLTNTFDPNEDIYVNFEMTDVEVGGTVSFSFYDPSGNFLFTDELDTDPPAPGFIWDWYRGYIVTSFSTPGEYKVDFYFQPTGGSNTFQESHNFTILGSSGPEDFTTSNATSSNTSPEIGESITISCSQNYSGNSSNLLNVKVGYYLSIDQATNANDIYLGDDTSNLNSSNNSETETETVTIPVITPGTYYLRYCADYNEQFDEENENNNCTSLQVQIQSSSSSSQFIVNSSLDTQDATPGDGTCDDGNGNCTLRAAIEEANSNANTNTILFENYITNVVFAADELEIFHPVTIDGGNTGNVVVDGQGLNNELEIKSNNVNLYGLWFKNYTSESVYIFNASNIEIGSPNKGCIFTENGVGIYFGGVCNNVDIISSYFGTDQNFTPNIGQTQRGISSSSSGQYNNFTIGGAFASDESNYFCSNNGPGLIFQGPFDGQIIGNYFGTDPSLSLDLGNGNGAWVRGGVIGGSENNKNVFYYGTSDHVRALDATATEISFNDFYYNEDAVVLSDSPQYVYKNVFVCNSRAIIGSAIDEATITEATTEMISGTCLSGATVEVHYFINNDCPSINYCQGSEFIDFAQVSGSTWSLSGSFIEGNEIAVLQHNSSNQTSYYSNCLTVVASFICDLEASPDITNTSCGLNNGSILFNISGGITPISIDLNGISYTGQSVANNLSPNSYTLTISDANNCMEQYNLVVNDSEVLNATIDIIHTSCDLDNGSITINPLNGAAPYQFTLNNSAPINVGFYDNLPSGMYDLSVVDNNGCIFNQPIVINESTGVGLSTTASPTTCGENNGDINAVATSNAPGQITYLLNQSISQNQGLFSNLESGSYVLLVTDSEGCTAEENYIIDSSEPLSVMVDIQHTSCNEDNGVVTFIPQNGQSPFTFVVDGFSQSTPVFNSISAGIHSVSVMDINDCTYTSSVSVNGSIALNATTETQSTSCGDNNGQASFIVLSGNPPYMIRVNEGPYMPGVTISDLAPGNYVVDLLDSENCFLSSDVFIDDSQELIADITEINTTCGVNNGEILVTVISGNGNYLYEIIELSLVQNTPNFDNIPPGIYNIKITDQSFCEKIYVANINPSVDINIFSISNPTSCGEGNGSFELIVDQGTFPVEFSINGNSPSTDLFYNNLSAGLYAVEATDSDGCEQVFNIEIGESEEILISSSITHTSCGENNGSATFQVVSGIEPVNYFINGISVGSSGIVNNLSPDTYNVEAVDDEGCSTEFTITIEASDELIANYEIIHTSCNDENGIIAIEVVSGTSPFLYKLNDLPFSNQNTYTALEAGLYELEVQDNEGCLISTTIEILSSELPAFNEFINNTTCGENNGEITIEPTAGIAPFLFDFGIGLQASPSIFDLSPGFYTIVIQDNEGCTNQSFVEIETSQVPELFTDITPENCGAGDGIITLISTSFAIPITYTLESPIYYNSNSTGVFTFLEVGVYSALVEDGDGCILMETLEVSSFDGPTINAETTNADCDQNNGTIGITIDGGNNPITTTINGEEIDGGFITDLSPGTYTIISTDANDCQGIIDVEVEEITFDLLIETTNSLCIDNNGSVEINVIDGEGDFVYSIEDEGSNTIGVFTNLSSGDYVVSVEDSNNCVVEGTFNISFEEGLTLNYEIENPGCAMSNGSIIVIQSGGIAPISYLINNGSENNTGIFNNLSAGIYFIEVIDGNGCTSSLEITLSDIGNLTATISSLPDDCGNNTGSIEAIAFGGDGNYSYSLDNLITNETGLFINLSLGTYSIKISDGQGCVLDSLVSISGTPALIYEISITNETCGEENGAIYVESLNDDSPTYELINIESNQTGFFEDLAAGFYTLNISNINGCMVSEEIEIMGSPEVEIEIEVTQSSCGEANGIIVADAIQGTPPFTYTLNNNNSNSTGIFENLNAGLYTLGVEDQASCSKTTVLTVEDGGDIELLIIDQQSATCNNANGAISIEGINGISPYTYFLNGANSNSTGEYTNLQQGIYVVSAEDAQGCISSLEVVVENEGLTDIEIILEEASCGMSNASIEVIPTDGVAPYDFSLNSNTNQSGLFNGLEAGIYMLEIIDGLGCILDSLIQINSQGEVVLVLDEVIPPTSNMANGSIIVFASNGSEPYTYKLDNEENQTGVFSNISAGTYFAEVEDSDGCTSILEVIVEDATNALFFTIDISNETCLEGNGSISINAVGGMSPYMFQLDENMPQESNVFGNLVSGSYLLTVYDATGNLDTSVFQILNDGYVEFITMIQEPDCNFENGYIGIDIVNGQAPFTYLINGVVNEGTDFYNLPSGLYTISVLDNQGCSFENTISLLDQGSFEILANPTNATCGDANGSIFMLNLDNLALVYSINGIDFQENPVFNNLQEGSYSVIALNNADSCAVTTLVDIETSPPLELDYELLPPNCGEDNGSIILDISGGTGNFTVSINGVETEDNIENLGVGVYNIQVIDEIGCVSDLSVIIESMVEDIAIPIVDSYSICGDNCNGEMTIEIDENISSYVIFWPDGPSTETTKSNLCPGEYNLPIEYNNGCVDYAAFSISQSPIFEPEAISLNANCNNDNGVIFIPGAGGLDIQWDNGEVGNLQNNLPPGVYTFTILGEDGCQREESVDIIQLGGLDIITSLQHISCFGNSDGQININVSGSLAPYSIQWNNGLSEFSLDGLSSGIYSALIVDSTGTCSKPISIEILEPNLLAGTISELSSNNLIVEGIGGILPYQYLWNTGETSSIIQFDPENYYSVKITDANGCLHLAEYGTTSTIDLFTKVEIFPNPFSDKLNITKLPERDFKIKITEISGKSLEVPIIKNGKNQILDFSSFNSGIYIITIISNKQVFSKKVMHIN